MAEHPVAAGAVSMAGTEPVRHTSHVVDQSLAGVRLHAVEMGGLVIDQVASAVRALLDRDAALADLVLSREPQVNRYEQLIDRESLTFLALQQPVASDLRTTRAVARAALDLERVGDEAKKIARFAARVGAIPTHDPVSSVAKHLRHMATLAASMLRNAVRALDESNAELARSVIGSDLELDREFADGLRLIMSFVMEDRQFLKATIDTVFALKGLERIGDHSKNIAEQVLYMVEGDRRGAQAA